MKTPMLAFVAAVFAFSPLAQAQSTSAAGNSSHASLAAPAPVAEVAQGTGVLNKIDAAAGVVNITHDPIPVLKWPAMTMDFKVRDKKLLDGFKVGQAVSFGLVKDEKIGYVISSLTVVKK